MLYSDLDENGNPKELYCYEYSMNEVPPTEGNLAEYNNLSNIDWYVRKCPAFANNGCFRGNITVRATGIAVNAFNKGTNKITFMFWLYVWNPSLDIHTGIFIRPRLFNVQVRSSGTSM